LLYYTVYLLFILDGKTLQHFRQCLWLLKKNVLRTLVSKK